MPKQVLLFSLVAILGLLAVAWWLSSSIFVGPIAATSFNPQKTTLFYTADCADCQAVRTWLEIHQLPQKFTFEQVDINTPTAQVKLQQAALACNYPDSQGIELPLLFAQGKCYVTVTEIESFFRGQE